MIWKLLAACGMLRYPRALLKAQKIIPWLIILAGLVAYYNSLDGGFIYDDLPRIVDNSHIRRLWPAWETVPHSSRPVVQMSLAVNYALGGLNPRGYHAFNVLIHILAGLVLYGVMRRTLLTGTGRNKWGEAAPWLAGAVSLIWLVHPLQTESVTYTIQGVNGVNSVVCKYLPKVCGVRPLQPTLQHEQIENLLNADPTPQIAANEIRGYNKYSATIQGGGRS